MFMQMPRPVPHGSDSHSFTSGKGRDVKAVPGARAVRGHPPAPLTHAVVVLRVRPVARVAMAGVAGGALDALPVAADVLVQPALLGLCGRVGEGRSLSAASLVGTSISPSPHSYAWET